MPWSAPQVGEEKLRERIELVERIDEWLADAIRALRDRIVPVALPREVGENVYQCAHGHMHRGKGWAISCLGTTAQDAAALAPHPLLAMERDQPDPGSRAELVERIKWAMRLPLADLSPERAAEVALILGECLAELE